MVMKDVMEYDFAGTTNSMDNLNVKIHWGIEGIDRTDVGNWDADASGELIWDQNFNILPYENIAANQRNAMLLNYLP